MLLSPRAPVTWVPSGENCQNVVSHVRAVTRPVAGE